MIRQAVLADSKNLAALSIQVWLHTYANEGIRDEISHYVLNTFSEQYFQTLIETEAYRVYVYIENDHLIGFVALDLDSHFESTTHGFEVTTLYIQEHFQGKGIGNKLLDHIRSVHDGRFWLSTWKHNEPAIGFYKHYGLQVIGVIDFELGDERHENFVLSFKKLT